MPTPIWEIYQQLMFARNRGFALWDPEPHSYDNPITWGSVIYPATAGHFMELLNTTKEGDHLANKPDDYEKFEKPIMFGPVETIKDPVLSSKSVVCRKFQAEAGGNGCVDPLAHSHAALISVLAVSYL